MNQKLLSKDLVVVKSIFILLLCFSSWAYAGNGGGIPDGFWLFILVGWSPLFALVHFAVVSFLRLGKHFKHSWLLMFSLFLSMVSVFFWLYSVGFLLFQFNKFDLAVSVLVLIVSILVLFLIIWVAKLPFRENREENVERIMADPIDNNKTDVSNISKEKTQRPVAIIVISFYTAISSLFMLISGMVAIYYLMRSSSLFIGTPQDGNAWSYFMLSASILIGVLSLVSVFGLWFLQRWGWRVVFWLYILSVFMNIISIFSIYQSSVLTLSNVLFQLISITVAVAVILYLSKDEIKNLYNIGV